MRRALGEVLDIVVANRHPLGSYLALLIHAPLGFPSALPM